jgi:hypothetical protein
MADDEKTQSLELLSCTPEAYAASKRRNISSYRLVGLIPEDFSYGIHSAKTKLGELARSKGCVVVVNTQMIKNDSYYYFWGTGMFLRPQEEIDAEEKL